MLSCSSLFRAQTGSYLRVHLFDFWADRHISLCFLQFRIISRNTLISVASAARKVVFFKVSARCLCVSSEFLNDSDDFTENDIFQDGSSDI